MRATHLGNQPLYGLRTRLRFRREAFERNLTEAVSHREVAERSMARHDFAASAVRQAEAVPAVEPAEPRDESRRLARTPERTADLVDDRGVAAWVEPDVRIDRSRSGFDEHRRAVLSEKLQRRPFTAADGLCDGRLETCTEIEDEIGVEDVADRSRGQLQIVRLRTSRREILDGHRSPADLLGGVRKGIEPGDNLRRSRADRRRLRTATRRERGDHRQQRQRRQDENDSRLHSRAA